MQSHTPSAVRLVDNRRGRISLQYLDESQQHRLRTSIRAIAARSLYQWDEVGPHQADVLVLEGDQVDARSAAPFKLWLGQPTLDVFGDDVFSLPRTFSTPMLWGVLDLIALRLMDSRRQPTQASTSSFTDTAASDKPTYRLLKSVTLDARFREQRFRVAMDDMTTRAVSLDELIHHGELELEEARLLLRTLNELGMLEIRVSNQTVGPALAAQSGLPPDGWLSRARRWLHGRSDPQSA